MSSRHIDDVFADDAILRRKIKDICKKHMAVDEEMEREVRGQLKHVEEGTRTWEVEYTRIMEDIRRRKGLG